MSPPSFRRQGDRIRADLDPIELQLLQQLQSGLRATLQGHGPADPVIARLFPPAVRGDDRADAELRALIHDDLLASKLASLDELVTVLERATRHRSRVRVLLEPDEALLFLGVLNDLRLALGARIGIDRVDRDALDTLDEDTLQALGVLDHLAYLQEQILAVVDPPAVRHYEEGHEPPQ